MIIFFLVFISSFISHFHYNRISNNNNSANKSAKSCSLLLIWAESIVNSVIRHNSVYSNQVISHTICHFKKKYYSQLKVIHVSWLIEFLRHVTIEIKKIHFQISIFHSSNTKIHVTYSKQTNSNDNNVFIRVHTSVLKCKYLCHWHDWIHFIGVGITLTLYPRRFNVIYRNEQTNTIFHHK